MNIRLSINANLSALIFTATKLLSDFKANR